MKGRRRGMNPGFNAGSGVELKRFEASTMVEVQPFEASLLLG
jgi:hypothetical protein